MLRDTIVDMAARVDQLEDQIDADEEAKGKREEEVSVRVVRVSEGLVTVEGAQGSSQS